MNGRLRLDFGNCRGWSLQSYCSRSNIVHPRTDNTDLRCDRSHISHTRLSLQFELSHRHSSLPNLDPARQQQQDPLLSQSTGNPSFTANPLRARFICEYTKRKFSRAGDTLAFPLALTTSCPDNYIVALLCPYECVDRPSPEINTTPPPNGWKVSGASRTGGGAR